MIEKIILISLEPKLILDLVFCRVAMLKSIAVF